MPRVIVVGSLGFLGAPLSSALLGMGYEVAGIDIADPDQLIRINQPYIAQILSHPDYRHYKADVCHNDDIMDIAADESPECILHMGGRTGVESSFREPEDFFVKNVVSVKNVLDACSHSKCHNIIMSSSVAVYGESPGPVDEDAPLPLPVNPYARFKQFMEDTVKAYHDVMGLNISVLRIVSVYGPGQKRWTAIYKFVKAIDDGEPVTVYGDGSSSRDYIYLDDCIEGIIRALIRIKGFEVFNIGSQRPVLVKDMISLISQYLHKPAYVRNVGMPEGVQRATCADICKARRLLGFDPKTAFADGIKRYIEWYLSTKTLV